MGLTFLNIQIANPSKPTIFETVEFLIDSGAIYSVVPEQILKKLKIKPLTKQEFHLANGSVITRKRGGAIFQYENKIGVADVIFGEHGDSNLLGVTTLESLGFSLNPIKRKLEQLPMILATSSSTTTDRRIY